jgi:uncharacterized OsmC-like protein
VTEMPKIKTNAKWIENVRSIVDNSRTHSVVCDLSSAAGGGDSGPTALELTLMALADCGVTIFADVCKKSNIEPGKVEVVVEAEKSPDSPVITGVTMKVCVSAKARKELLEGAWRRTEANCPVLSIFKDPIPVKVEFEAKSE